MPQEQKKSYQFKPNQPIEVLFTFNEPKIGKGQYGQWYLYGCEINGIRETFFATDKLHAKIQKVGLKRGDKAIITKLLLENDKGQPYKDYELKVNGGIVEITKDEMLDLISPFETDKTRLAKEEIKENEKWAEIRKEKANGQAWGNSRTLAVQIVLQKYQLGTEMKDENFLKIEITKWANWLFRLEPNPMEFKEEDEFVNEPPVSDFPDMPVE